MARSTLVLASDFPSSENPGVVEWVTSGARHPKVAWIPPATKTARARLPSAERAFERQCGAVVELCDIDEAADLGQIGRLAEYDVVYLSGGDPLSFQRILERFELRERLLDCLTQGRVVVAASGGAMQFTPNLSLFRLLSPPRPSLEEVLSSRDAWAGFGLVGYELLPHLNRLSPEAIELVLRYSERVPHPVLALPDGSAVVDHGASGSRT
jgi:peptidase E